MDPAFTLINCRYYLHANSNILVRSVVFCGEIRASKVQKEDRRTGNYAYIKPTLIFQRFLKLGGSQYNKII